MKNIKIIRAHKAWKKYKQWAKGKTLISPITAYGQFKEIYLSTEGKNKLKKIEYESRYITSYKTALTFKHKFEEMTGKELSLETAKSTHTWELAKLANEEMKQEYHDLLAKGKSSEEASKLLSSYYFGS